MLERQIWSLSAFVSMISVLLVIGCMTARGASSDNSEEKALEIVSLKIPGLNARAVTAGNYSFADFGKWTEFWSKHHRTPAPEIDFGESTLVAVFLGQKPNPGYSVKIAGAREHGGETIVEIVEYLPSPEMMYAQVIVYPCDAALIPNVGRPIRFETTKKAGRP